MFCYPPKASEPGPQAKVRGLQEGALRESCVLCTHLLLYSDVVVGRGADTARGTIAARFHFPAAAAGRLSLARRAAAAAANATASSRRCNRGTATTQHPTAQDTKHRNQFERRKKRQNKSPGCSLLRHK
jgi:hypothetical protein